MTDFNLYIVAIVIHIVTAFYEFIIWKGNRGSYTYTTEDGQKRHYILFMLMAYIFINFGVAMEYDFIDFMKYFTVVSFGRVLFFNIVYNYLRKIEGNNTPILYFSPTYFFLDNILHDNPKSGYAVITAVFIISSILFFS